MAMIGLPKSPVVMPVARHNDLEAEANWPSVVVLDLNGFMFGASDFLSGE